MGFLRDLVVRIKGDKSQLDSTLESAKGSMGRFAATVVAAAAAGAAAFKIVYDWFIQTDTGAKALNITMGVTRQLLTDLITKQGIHFKEAIANAKAQSKIKEDDAKEAFQAQVMQSALNNLIREASDRTLTHSERLEKLTQAMAKEKELKAFLLADAKEELKVAFDFYKINQDNTKARENFYAAAKRVAEIEGSESRRLQSQFTQELVEQKKRADELVDAFTPLIPTLEEIKEKAGKIFFAKTDNVSKTPQNNKTTSVFGEKTFGVAPELSNQLAKGPNAEPLQNLIDEKSTAWQETMDMIAAEEKFNETLKIQTQIADNLVGVFDNMFSNMDKGFQGMIDGFVQGLKRLAQEIMAKAAAWLIMSALFPQSAIAKGGIMDFIGLGKGLFSGGGGGAGVGNIPVSSGGGQKLVATLRGKDIAISLQRHYEDNA